MDNASQPTSLLTRCLRLNALALAFSLAHTTGDYGIVAAMPGFNAWAMAGYLGLTGAIYGWWGWSLARAAAGSRTGLLNLLPLGGGWAILHGATFVFTPITNLLADIIHFGSLIFGVWAAYATWRVLRVRRLTAAAAH